MLNKIITLKNKFNNGMISFFIANLLFSFSTMIGALSLAYILNVNDYANFTLQTQYLLYGIIIFEFGLSTSFIKHFSEDNLKTLNSQNSFEFLIYSLLIILIIINCILNLFEVNYSIGELNLNYFFIACIVNLIYIFNRSYLLVSGQTIKLLYRTIIIFIIRVVILALLLFNIIMPIYLFVGFFIIPFIYEVFEKIIYFFKDKIEFKRIEMLSYFQFSFSVFFSNAIYNMSTRIIFFGLGYYNLKDVIAALGFTFSFIGVVTIFNATIKSYFLGYLDFNDKEKIIKYIKKVEGSFVYFFLSFIVFTIMLIGIVQFFKPQSFDLTFISLLIMTMLYAFGTMYLGLFTVLSKTFSLLKQEILINILRLFLIGIVTLFFVENYPIITYLLIVIIIVTIEYVFYKYIILSKILKK